MPVDQIDPAGDKNATWTIVGAGGSRWASVSDGTDAQYIQKHTVDAVQQCNLSNVAGGFDPVLGIQAFSREGTGAGVTIRLGIDDGATADVGTYRAPGAGWHDDSEALDQSGWSISKVDSAWCTMESNNVDGANGGFYSEVYFEIEFGGGGGLVKFGCQWLPPLIASGLFGNYILSEPVSKLYPAIRRIIRGAGVRPWPSARELERVADMLFRRPRFVFLGG